MGLLIGLNRDSSLGFMAVGYVGRLGMRRNSFAGDESMFIVSASIVQTLRAVVRNSFLSMRLMSEDGRYSACFMRIDSLQKARGCPMHIGT